MTTQLVVTADGSHTLLNQALNVHYHSIHGALQESLHIFIDLGLREAFKEYKPENGSVLIFEMGFGTGLNALLTWLEAEKSQIPVHYVAVEAFPVAIQQHQLLNYGGVLNTAHFSQLFEASWGEKVQISPYFSLEKHHTTLQSFQTSWRFDAVYYDAFAPSAQPELWTQDIFEKLAQWLKQGSNLTTYCSKGYVQRNLKAAGFEIQKHPGPGRKREVLKAIFSDFQV